MFRYRRRTRRCGMVVTQHGLKCSSESARKLLSAIGVPLSGDAVLRDIHRMSVPERCEVKEIGVDSSRNSRGRFSTSHIQRSQRVTGRGTQHRPDIQEAGYCQTDRKEIYGLRHFSEKGQQGAIALLSLRHICGSFTPFYDHYSYLSDGHHGHRSGQEVEKMKQRPNCDREPLLPIRQIAHMTCSNEKWSMLQLNCGRTFKVAA